jgi:hypothetical protein
MFKKNRIALAVFWLGCVGWVCGIDIGLQARWVDANYDDLINRAQLTASGRTVGAVLGTFSAGRRDQAQLQPFLDRYAGMLDDLVAAERPSDRVNYAAICDSFPAGSAQPAWAALVRSGAMHISSDGKGRVRIFLPVSYPSTSVDPKVVYRSRYGVLRHPLGWLADKQAGQPLTIEVFCYNNDYARQTLHLYLQSYSFMEGSFPSSFPQALNLDELREFMQVAPRVIGARIEAGSLVIVGDKSNRETLAGSPISIADLAIAYRACWHSGADEPYVSLDPHADPTKVTVSLGGYLEDTRIGTVLLEADKRFKSFSTGLSPDGVADITPTVQARVPTFIPSDQRHFSNPTIETGWRGTRFWFYPDSIVVESNLDGSIAAIVSPRFTADAERSEEDMRKLGVEMKSAKVMLDPETRESIAEFNRDYDQLRGNFPELNELDTVGRIMGLFVWSKRSLSRNQLDWDALLGVELPAYSTPRDKYQLITASHLVESGEAPALSQKINRFAFTRMLSVRFAEFRFSESEMVRLREGSASRLWDVRRTTAGLWSGVDADKPIGELLNDKVLVQNFASVMSKRFQKSPQMDALKARLDATKAEMARLDALITQGKAQLAAMNSAQFHDEYNKLVDNVNETIGARRNLTVVFNEAVDAYNASPQVTRSVVQVGGGISVRPESFSIRSEPASPAVAKVKELSSGTKEAEGFVMSRPASSGVAPKQAYSAVLPPKVTERAPTPAGKGYFSTCASGMAGEHLVAPDGASVTSVRFAPDGSQSATKLERQPSPDGVPRYRFSRVQGQRFIKPAAVESAK